MNEKQLIRKALVTIRDQFELLEEIPSYQAFCDNIAPKLDTNLVDAHEAVVTGLYEICMGRGFE